MNGYKRWVLGIGFCLIFGTVGEQVEAQVLHQGGIRGKPVYDLQDRLFRLKYLTTRPTGYFGPLTTRAVKRFQRDHGLSADGIVGRTTEKALKQSPGRQEGHSRSRWTNGMGGVMTWEVADKVWQPGQIGLITDVLSGKTFHVKRFGGDWHCDTEPLTRSDTEIMLATFGGHWSWQRRAVIVEVNGYRSAASINGYPHGPSRVIANGFRGHFCVHFLGSRVHRSLQVDPEHQRMIRRAAAYPTFVSHPLESPRNSEPAPNEIASE